jgi:hypothetical protein
MQSLKAERNKNKLCWKNLILVMVTHVNSVLTANQSAVCSFAYCGKVFSTEDTQTA